MPRTVGVLILCVAMLAAVGFASINSATGGPGSSPAIRWAQAPSVLSTRQVTEDSLYWKLYTSTTELYSSPKTRDVTAAQPTSSAWQSDQSVPCMTPDGQYVFEVSGTNMRRANLLTDSVDNYTLADASGGTCGTDGQYVYVPNGTTTRKYSLTGTLVSTTTTDFAPWVGTSTFGFGVANDTVWLTPDDSGTTWYGYACSKFTGGSITHDATWATSSGEGSAMSVAYDGQYYYMAFGGYSANAFLRFYRDRTLYSSGTVTGDARSVMCRNNAVFKVLFAGTESDNPTLRAQIVGASGGQITAVDYFDAGSSALQAYSLYQQGYRVIITFGGNYLWTSGAVFGDSLAVFVDLGGGALNMTYTTCAGGNWCIGGRYMNQYMPVPTVAYGGVPCPSITILEPSHPIMNGVTAIGNFTCEPYTMSLRSPTYSVRIANWDVTNSYIECAAFDSAGKRTVFLGYHPNYNSGGTGQWLTQLVNALIWMGNPAPTVGVTAPNGSENWIVGTVHNIAWSQTSNGIKDSIYYSTDAGSSWSGVAYYDPPPVPLQHAWTVPSTPTAQARVKVVSWSAMGGRAEDKSDSNFTIALPAHDVGVLAIIQPVDTVDSGTTVVPSAAVKNFGNLEEVFPVRFSIGGFYTQDTSVTIGPGATDTVTFLDWMAGQIGMHAVRCSTRLDADQDSANDRAVGTVVVEPSGGIGQTENNALPLVFALNQPYPNPLASGAAIRYALPRPARVELRIYDVAGTLVRRLVDGDQLAGYRSAYWNGRNDRGRLAAPGVYYCRFRAGDFLAVQKLVVRR